MEPKDTSVGTTETAVPDGTAAKSTDQMTHDYLSALAAKIEGGSAVGLQELAKENARHRIEKKEALANVEKYKAKVAAEKVEREQQRTAFESAITRVHAERALAEAGITPESIDADLFASAVSTVAKRAELKVNGEFGVESARPLSEVAGELAKSFSISKSKEPEPEQQSQLPLVIAGAGGSVVTQNDTASTHWTQKGNTKYWGPQAEGWIAHQ